MKHHILGPDRQEEARGSNRTEERGSWGRVGVIKHVRALVREFEVEGCKGMETPSPKMGQGSPWEESHWARKGQ